ncbi:MAG TPA: TonB-dependent receptor plug domain-containing protein, partial [Chitinophagaceae bacterium]|nr:TonB-dependent receptor plug domain-containing protein [Chitinophagaceae bacterium]
MKKNIIVVLIINFSVITVAHAQQQLNQHQNSFSKSSVSGSLNGKVIDAQTGVALAEANVFIHDINIGAKTENDGSYKTASVPGGTYLVEVSFVGYKSVSENININGATTHDFKLEENYTEASEVVVTGVSKATQIKRNPVPVISVGHDYLMSNLSTNAIDAIAKLPGIRGVTTGPNVSKPFIRGLGFNRILTLYDGVRQEGQQWGDEHGIEVDQYSIQKVEVIKGPASLSYGSDALAGVVNLIPVQAAPEGKIIGDIVADYQTNNKYLGG